MDQSPTGIDEGIIFKQKEAAPKGRFECPLWSKGDMSPQNVMSALPPKADMCVARAYVCFGPIVDLCTATNCKRYSVTSSARTGGQRLGDALEFYQHSVTRRLDDATLTFGERRVDQL
jgi:hypothetical protein